MHALTPSFRTSWFLVAIVTSVLATVAATRPRPTPAPSFSDAPPFEDQLVPAASLQCEHWSQSFDLTAAMQTCSVWADLDTNERWMLGVRASIVEHHVVDVIITEIEHDCDYCFDREAKGREDRARYTLFAINACMRTELSAATFPDDTCTLDTRWQIKSDW
ncbi:MAG TPA: hypothetical protein VMZ53_00375 [Kofleriaceae bacterium]|nr:hypothetical protein [Kofleriaceae bacterium]